MEKKDKIEIIIDKIKVCFWEHEDFDDIRVREILEQELDRAREEVIKNLIKKIEEANCDSISLELLREINLSKLTTK